MPLSIRFRRAPALAAAVATLLLCATPLHAQRPAPAASAANASRAPACSIAHVAETRARFLQGYQAGQHAPAAALLQSLLDRCGRGLSHEVDVEVRNDLAVAYRQLRRPDTCLRTLQPLQAAFIEEGESRTPAGATQGADWAELMARVTRHNWRSCGGKLP